MSYIVATREINSLVNKIKYREKRIAQQYREIHDMVSELEEFMGNATELVFNNKLLLRRNENSEILPIEIDVFSEAITYCYHEIIEKQLESISQKKQRIRELKLEIEELVKVNEALRRNKKDLEAQIQKSNLQENNTDKTRTCLIASITFAVLLVIALLLTATLRESAVVLLFLGLSTVSFIWNSILVFEKQSLNNRKDELTEKEFLFNKAILSFENEKQLFEQEKLRLKGINETTIKTVNEKLQIARQQKEKYLTQEKEYQEKLAQLNEQFANLKEQIEAGEHAKRKAENLELDYKRLFEKYHNRESEIQTLQSDLNNSTNENKRLSSKIASLGAEIEKIQKQQEDSLKEKQELERKCQYLKSHNASLENQNKDFQRQCEDSQNNYSELDIEFKRVEAENQELERKNQNLISQETSLISKNKELQTQNNSFQSKISDMGKEIKRVQEKNQEQKTLIQKMNSHITSLYSKNEELQKQVKDCQKELQRLKDENYEYECKCLNLDSQKKYLEMDLESVKEISQMQIEDFKLSIAELEEKLNGIQKENRVLKNEKGNIEYQIPYLETENKELHKQNQKYRTNNSELKNEVQKLKEENDLLKNELLSNKTVQKDYLNLQAKFNALQKENGELRYNLLKLDSKKAQEIIRRNSSDDELDNSSQSVSAGIGPATPTKNINANSEQDLFYEIADEIIKKASYSEEELIALYRRFNMSIFSGIDKINSWTDDVFGDVLIFEENKSFVIDPEIAAKVRNREVENEYN